MSSSVTATLWDLFKTPNVFEATGPSRFSWPLGSRAPPNIFISTSHYTLYAAIRLGTADQWPKGRPHTYTAEAAILDEHDDIRGLRTASPLEGPPQGLVGDGHGNAKQVWRPCPTWET